MRRQIQTIFFVFLFGLLLPYANAAAISVTDDSGQTVTLKQPARRIISIAPHAAELVYTAGAGAYLVGVGAYSNFPPQVKRLPSVGDVAALDLERIISLKPDLIIAWSSGNTAAQMARLKKLGIPLFESEPRDFESIASNIERIAQLAGTTATGRQAARAFRTRLQNISARYEHQPPVRVFYQIWPEPVMTLNDEHIVGKVIKLCGGRNVFGKLKLLAPTVGVEDVVRADPEVIFAADEGQNDSPSGWKRFPKMAAVARGNIFSLNSDLMTRPGPRILDAAEMMCEKLEDARKK
jgi:iron complex transport system substrate-binding protein